MKYSYNKLWKILIDRKITKSEMRKQAGFTTNMLAKMGRDEPVSMETLAKICTCRDCAIEDIVEINKENEGQKNEYIKYFLFLFR